MAAGALFAASAGLNFIGGIFDFLESREAAAAETSRSSLLRLEAEADAQRFEEDAEAFKGRQQLRIIKSGTVGGSPLLLLDETVRRAQENVSAIRARGAALEQQSLARASRLRSRGRSALLSGITGGIVQGARAGQVSQTGRTGLVSQPPSPSFSGDTGFRAPLERLR